MRTVFQVRPGGSSTELAFRRHLPHLRFWAGLYALVVGDRVVGVFRDEATARHMGTLRVDPTVDVLVRRIESARDLPRSTRSERGGGPVTRGAILLAVDCC